MNQPTGKCTKCGCEQEIMTEDVNTPKRCAGCGNEKSTALPPPKK